MSDALDDWEQADEVEIQVPVAVPAVVPIKNKIKILSRPTSSSPGSSASINPTVLGSTGGSGGSGFGAGGGTPMILKRNPGSTGGGQQGSSPIARQETNPFGSGNNIYSSRQQRQGVGQRDEDLDDIGEYTRRQMSGLSLRERNRALWDEANAYEQPIIARADTTRTEYVPEIRILRRPKSPVQAVRVSNQVKSKPLAQREADYNAAREKIFGPSPTPSPPINDTLASTTATNFGAAGGGGVRAYSGGAGSPRRQSPSVGGSSSSPNSRPSSRPSSRPGSPSIPHQTVQIYSAGGSTGAFESALETVKPIEFRGGPPPSRRGGGGSSTGGNGSSRGGGQEGMNTAIRQPMGPTSPSNGHSGGGSKPRGRGRGRGGSSSGSGAKSLARGGGGELGDAGSTTKQEGSIGFRRPIGRGNNNQPRPAPSS